VGDPRSFDDLELLELRPGVAQSGEQSGPVSEDQWNDRDHHLVEQASRKILVDNRCAAAERDVLAIGGDLRLLERCLDAVGDEIEGRAAIARLAGSPSLAVEQWHTRGVVALACHGARLHCLFEVRGGDVEVERPERFSQPFACAGPDEVDGVAAA
jgi:hypothetical protein